jgi:hypothetical protein
MITTQTQASPLPNLELNYQAIMTMGPHQMGRCSLPMLANVIAKIVI